MKQLESIGNPKVIIVPNSFHKMDYHLYQERYKGITVTAPSFLQKTLNLEISIEDWLEKNEEMKKKFGIHNPTNGQFEYLYEFRIDENSAAAVMCDQMFNLKKETGTFKGFIQYHMGSSGFFGVSFIGRMILKCMGKTKVFKDVRFVNIDKIVDGKYKEENSRIEDYLCCPWGCSLGEFR